MLNPKAYSRGTQNIDCEITFSLLDSLHDCAVVGHTKNGINIYHRGHLIGNISIPKKVSKITEGKAYDSEDNIIKMIPDFFRVHLIFNAEFQ